jgi:hypothetical protein
MILPFRPTYRSLAAAASLGVAAFLVLVPPALAHGVGARCKLNGNRVEVEAYFDDDTEAAESKVRVEDGRKQVIAEGIADTAGRWSFPRPAAGSYVVMVDAGAGHRAQVRVTIPQAEPSSPAADECCCCTEPSSLASPSPSLVSEGPDRGEFTTCPWLKLGIGVGVLGGLGLAFLASRWVGRTSA